MLGVGCQGQDILTANGFGCLPRKGDRNGGIVPRSMWPMLLAYASSVGNGSTSSM